MLQGSRIKHSHEEKAPSSTAFPLSTHVDKVFLLLVRSSYPYSGEVIQLLVTPFSPLKSIGKLITFESSNTYHTMKLWT